MSVNEISKEVNKNESSIRKIIQEYEARGRVNKLLTRSAKQLILSKRKHGMSLQNTHLRTK